MTNPDAETISLVRLAIASLAVIGLLGLFAWLLRYVAAKGWTPSLMSQTKRRMKLIETLPLDARRRLVIVQCDNTEHLILLGVGQDLVVTSPLPKTEQS